MIEKNNSIPPFDIGRVMQWPWTCNKKEKELLFSKTKQVFSVLQVGGDRRFFEGQSTPESIYSITDFRVATIKKKYEYVVILQPLNFVGYKEYKEVVQKALNVLTPSGRLVCKVLVKKQSAGIFPSHKDVEDFDIAHSGIFLADILGVTTTEEGEYLVSHQVALTLLEKSLASFGKSLSGELRLFSMYYLFKKKVSISMVDEWILDSLLFLSALHYKKYITGEGRVVKSLLLEFKGKGEVKD